MIVTPPDKIATPDIAAAKTAKKIIRDGSALLQDGNIEEAVEVYMEVENRFGTHEDPEIAEQVAIALLKIGVLVGLMSEPEDGIGLCDIVINRYKAIDVPALNVQVANAILLKSPFLDNIEASEEAVEACDQLIERYGQSDLLELDECVAQAFITKANSLKHLRQPKQQLQAFDEVLDRFSTGMSPSLDEQLATALVNKASLLGMVMAEEKQAITLCEQVQERFSIGQSAVLDVQIANAIVNKGILLSLIDRADEALEASDEALVRFGDSDMDLFNDELIPAQQMLDVCDDNDPALSRLIGLRVRSRACFAVGDEEGGSRALEELLEWLPASGKVTQSLINTLLFIAYRSGPERVLALIEASPSLDMLQPLVDAIQAEISSGDL